MGLDRPNQVTALCVPQFDGFVYAAGCEHAAIGAERERRDQAIVSLERSDRGALGAIPYSNGVINAARRQRFAVGTESDGCDSAQVARQGPHQLSSSGVPQLYRPLRTAGRYSLSVSAVGNRGGVGSLLQCAKQLAGHNIPDRDDLQAAGYQGFAIRAESDGLYVGGMAFEAVDDPSALYCPQVDILQTARSQSIARRIESQCRN